MKPLIFDFQIPRIEQNIDIQYEYDESQSLNIYKSKGLNKPFIDLEAKDLDTLTQTRVIKESSDSHFSLSEMATKTKTGNEKEDLHDVLLELKTKTFTVKERDD